MKKRILLVLLAMALAVSLVAFAACKEEEAPPVEEEEEVWQWPERLSILCTGSLGVASTTGYMSEMAKDTGMQVRIVPETNFAVAGRWLHEGRFFSWTQGPPAFIDLLHAIKGTAARDGGPFQIRMIWACSKSNMGYFVRGDSEIKTIYDIKPGVKFVEWTFMPGMKAAYPAALLAWVGVDPEDVNWVPAGSYGAGIRAISGGQADITLAFPTSPDVYEAEAAPHGIRWLELPYAEDPEGAARLLDVRPEISFFPVEPGGGVESAVGVLMLGSASAIHVSADADTELVYNFVKWLDEKYDLYKDNHPWNKLMTIDITMELVETYFVPAHEGLVKYLKEKGLWTAAHEARQQQNIEFLTRHVDAYQKAIDMADEQGIAVDPENDEWQEFWENYKKQINLPGFRMFPGLE